jgi:ABC-2 type transport system ATP-binding protein
VATNAIIDVRNLRKRYGTLQAVDGVSFNVERNEVFGILGPNGAGKTTTLEMIEGMRPIDEGTATVDGVDVAKDPRGVKRRIGIQLQSSAFFDELNLVELLELFGQMHEVPGPDPLRRPEAALFNCFRARQRSAGPLPR